MNVVLYSCGIIVGVNIIIKGNFWGNNMVVYCFYIYNRILAPVISEYPLPLTVLVP